MIPLDIYFLPDVFYYFQWKQGALCTELLITGGLMVGWMRRLLYFKEKKSHFDQLGGNWEEEFKKKQQPFYWTNFDPSVIISLTQLRQLKFRMSIKFN